MKVLALLACVAGLFSPTIAHAQDSNEGEGTDESPYIVNRTDREIAIDGIINDEEWQDALKLTIGYEVEPGENIKPPVKTEFYITYNDFFVLAAFRSYDPDPEAIRARFRDRDDIRSDDWVGLTLDTFNDSRRAYEFLINPFGVQSEAINDEVAGDFDPSWDAIYESEGRITDFGYEVEVAIPVSQLRIQNVEGPQTWGIDATRTYPRSTRHRMGLFPRDRSNSSYLSQTIKIRGFEGMERGNHLEITPTLTGARVDERTNFPDGDLEEVDTRADAGVTARWGVTSNINLLGTINPDFSQVEADEVQLDINRRFTLFFPETRPFFVEGQSFFETPEMNLLHTRNIVDPDYALKITGKQGRHTYGVFTARDTFTSVILPGQEGSDAGSFDFESDATVGRYQFDLGQNSSLGTMVSRRAGNEYENNVGSIDGNIRFTDSLQLKGTAAFSESKYNQQMVDGFGLNESDIDGYAVAGELEYFTRNYRLSAEYSRLSDNFRADLGFTRRVGIERWETAASYRWWGGSDRWFNTLTLNGNIDETTTSDGRLLEREMEASVSYQGPYQTGGFALLGTRIQGFQNLEFDQNFFFGNFNIRPNSTIFLSTSYGKSDAIDFQNVRAGERTTYFAETSLNLGRHIISNTSINLTWFDVDAGELFDTFVLESRTAYQVNRRMRFRAIVQFASINRDPALYIDDVDAEEEDLFLQLLFSYKINPQTVLFLGYDDSFVADDEISLTRARRGFFFKIGYAWLP